MPLCSVTAHPGAVRRSNNVNKRLDEEQKINKPAIVPVRIAATRKLKNYTWHMLPDCTQHCCSTLKSWPPGTQKTKICKKKLIHLQNMVRLQKCLFPLCISETAYLFLWLKTQL